MSKGSTRTVWSYRLEKRPQIVVTTPEGVRRVWDETAWDKWAKIMAAQGSHEQR